MTDIRTTDQLPINQTDTQMDNQTDTEPKITKQPSSILLDSTTRRSSKNVHLTFAAPLKILDIDSSNEYNKSVLCAFGIGLSQILIGATIMSIFLYSIRTGDTHAFMCSLGYHFFTVEAILTFNQFNGWSKPLRLRHKRFIHILLQSCSLIFSAFGTLLYMPSEHVVNTNYHGKTGFVTNALALITLMLAPLAYYRTHRFSWIHVFSGLITFMMSSITLCLGIMTPQFMDYVDSSIILFIILSFITFYSLLTIVMSVIKHL